MKRNTLISSLLFFIGLIPLTVLADGGRYGSCSYYWIWLSLGILVWLALASTLLFFTWNKVIAALFNLKKANFWQALLLVALLATFCGPHYLAKKHGRHNFKGKGHHHKECKGGECPYSKKRGQKVR